MTEPTQENDAAVPFSLVDMHGKVLTSGMTLTRPVQMGCETLDEMAPENSYWKFPGWAVIPAQPTPQHVFDWPTHTWRDGTTLDERRAIQQRVVDQAFEDAAAALTGGYPASERMTWPTQQAEVLAWEAKPSAPTPYLDGIAAARGIPVAEMRSKTLEAVKSFLAASQALVGRRQALRDAIATATTQSAIQAVTWTA